MKFGAHISTRKPFYEAVNRAKEIGCECMQIFANSPQRWNPIPIDDRDIAKFIALNEEANINPVIIHSIYLLNLASSNPFFYEASIRSLIDDMHKAKSLGAFGVNTHLGSTKGSLIENVMNKVEGAIKKILSESDPNISFIIENSAGAGNIIGDTIDEIAEIIDHVKSDRVKVLIDTAHAFESGCDLTSEAALEKYLNEFDKKIGLDKLVGFHLNDSKTKFNSNRDRHADIGKGEIGLESFKLLLNHPKLADKFGILETPEDEMPWKEQLNLLRRMKAS